MPVGATPERHPELLVSPKPKAPTSAAVLGAEAPDLLYSSIKMVTALVFVLSIMLGCYYLFKKTLGKKMGFAGKDRLIKVVSSAYIGPKKSIALVEVAGETLVLGISGDQMTLLSKMMPPEAPAREETAEIPRHWQNHGARNFAEALKSAGNGIPAGEDLWAQKES
jgi:flagellar protein FliO/FliZ